MKAVLLAAGTGSRLYPLTANAPKALLSVRGRPLIDYSIDFVQGLVDEVCVVGGYLYELLYEYLAEKYPEVLCIENPEYQYGSMLTLEKVLPSLDRGFVLMNIDHIYPQSFAKKLFHNVHGIMACCDFDRGLGLDDMKVLTTQGELCAISKTLTSFHGGYIGMSIVHAKSLPAYVQAAEELLAHPSGREANVEALLQYFVHRGYPVSVKDFSGQLWFEVDSQEDLQRVNSCPPDLFKTGRRSSE